MASVTHQTQLASWIDDSLDYLTGEWAAIPEIAEEWESWDELDRLELQQWCDEGLLKPAQLQRFENLHRLMQRHRATLEELLED